MTLLRSPARPLAHALAASAWLLAACGVPARTTLPRADVEMLAFAPRDAFFSARIDVERIRTLPAWDRFADALSRQDDELAVLANGTDRIYVVIGGTIDSPEVPPSTDAEGNYVETPAWAELARGMRGRIPEAILVVNGSTAATLCAMAREVGETHETRGYRWASNKGIAVVQQSQDTCLFTFVPVFEALVARERSSLPASVGRLAALGRGDDLGIAGAVWDLDSPGFEDVLESAGPREDADADGQRWAAAFRRILAAFAHGISDAEWSVHADDDGGYTATSRIVADDRARGVMYRELSEIYFEILRALVETEAVPAEARTQLRTMYEGMTVEPRDDGFAVVARIEERTVATMLDLMIPNDAVPRTETAVEAVADEVEPLYSLISGSAAETIARVEPRLADVDDAPSYHRGEVRTELAAAYATVGRFDDARAQLRAALGDAEESSDPPLRAHVQAQRCQLELTVGHAQAARAIVEEARTECASSYCGEVRLLLDACDAVAQAELGDLDAALAALDLDLDVGLETEFALALAEARMRVLLAAGRAVEAAATAHALCATNTTRQFCAPLVALEAEALARTDASLDRVLDHVTRVRDRYATVTPTRVVGELEVAVQRAECEIRTARAPRDADTVATCRAALARVVELQGEAHPETLRTRLALARALAAARDRAGLAEQLAAVDARLGALGPNGPLRRERAALGGGAAPARRPR